MAEMMEHALAAETGVHVRELRAIRAAYLAEGTDWRKDGRNIILTEKAAAKVKALLGLPWPDPDLKAAADETAADEAAAEAEELAGQDESREAAARATGTASAPQEAPAGDAVPAAAGPAQINVANVETFDVTVTRKIRRRDLLVADLDGVEVRVKIPKAVFERFTLGMVLHVRRTAIDQTLFELAGAPPRWRGRL